MKYIQTTIINGKVVGNAFERTAEDVAGLLKNLPQFEKAGYKTEVQNENGNYIITVTIENCGKVVAKIEAQ